MVVIIGASTSGLFAAYLLAQEKVPVSVFEQHQQLASPRTLIVTSGIKEVLDFVPHEAILNSVKRIQLLSRTSTATVELKRPDLILERGRFIKLLAEKAKRAGAQIELGHKFLGFRQGEDGLLIRLEDRERGFAEVKADILIGADGAFSAVARAAGMDGQPGKRNVVALLQARVALPLSDDFETTKVWFDRRRTGFFYWLIPESEERGVVGLIARDMEKARKGLDEFLAWQELKPLSFQAGEAPLYHPALRASQSYPQGRVYLVGDAAGQVKASTVGGVVTGLRGARALVRAIVRGTEYERELRELRKELRVHLYLRRLLDRFTDSDYDELLRLLNEGVRETLQTYTRDEASDFLPKLLLAQPRLLPFAGRLVLSSAIRSGIQTFFSLL